MSLSDNISAAEAARPAAQSRVGKQPVSVPAGVSVEASGGQLKVKGPKGLVVRPIPSGVDVLLEGGVAKVDATSCGRQSNQMQGLVRALLQAQVKGVTEGYKVALDLYGVGYRAELAAEKLTLLLGLSHPVVVDVPKDISVKIETIDEGGTKRPRIHLESVDNQLLGQFRSKVKSFRPPEPYKGKGVRVMGEKIREKAGKSGAKGR